ncbi:MAG: tRNA (adenosine(37)-N6)-threonylcarbamoyltransferase complex ATPase subunit type 1 TsaE [Phycisphaerales bacterium JB040]
MDGEHHPQTVRIEIGSLGETEALGRELATLLRAGDIVRLEGDLGAGKTTLVRAVANALGADAGLVSSPTYVFMHVYPVRRDDEPDGHPGRIGSVVHVDCYRMSSGEDLDTIGWDAAMDDDAVALIEWPERVGEALDESACATVRLEHAGEDAQDERRLATIQLPDTWAARAGIDALRLAGVGGRPDTTCPVTGDHVPGDSPTWPFASERAQMADLYKWFSGQHTISRPLEQRDLEEGID